MTAPATISRDAFLLRYKRFRQVHDCLLIILLLPFFVALLWFLFATDYAFQLLHSWRAAASGVALLVFCFGGIWAWFAGIPVVLRRTGLVCPSCGAAPKRRLVERHFALRTRCSRCGTKVFEEDWASAGNKGVTGPSNEERHQTGH